MHALWVSDQHSTIKHSPSGLCPSIHDSEEISGYSVFMKYYFQRELWTSKPDIKISLEVSENLEIDWVYEPAVPLLGIYLKDCIECMGQLWHSWAYTRRIPLSIWPSCATPEQKPKDSLHIPLQKCVHVHVHCSFIYKS